MKVKEYLNIKDYKIIDNRNYREKEKNRELRIFIETRICFLSLDGIIETFDIIGFYCGKYVFEINELNDKKINLIEKWLNSEHEGDFKFDVIMEYDKMYKRMKNIKQGIAFHDPLLNCHYSIFNLSED